VFCGRRMDDLPLGHSAGLFSEVARAKRAKSNPQSEATGACTESISTGPESTQTLFSRRWRCCLPTAHWPTTRLTGSAAPNRLGFCQESLSSLYQRKRVSQPPAESLSLICISNPTMASCRGAPDGSPLTYIQRKKRYISHGRWHWAIRHTTMSASPCFLLQTPSSRGPFIAF
jgi:hypothetical protein